MAIYAIGDVQGCCAELEHAARAHRFRSGPRPALVRRRPRQSRAALARRAAAGAPDSATRPSWCSATTTCTCCRSRAATRTCAPADRTLQPILEAPDRERAARLAAVAAAAAPRRRARRHDDARRPAAAVGHRAGAPLRRGTRGRAARRHSGRAVRRDVRQPAGPVARRPRGRGSPALHHQRAHAAARLRRRRADCCSSSRDRRRRLPAGATALVPRRRPALGRARASSAGTGPRSATSTRAACSRSTRAACGAARSRRSASTRRRRRSRCRARCPRCSATS